MVKAPNIDSSCWLNGEKPEIAGKVVLVDFWTYSCVNCLRTIPHLKKLWDKYKDKDFVMIGVHSPEFEFEKDENNVKKALKDLGIDWPVVLDNDFSIWNSFANKYWPAKYLINTDGKIVYQHFGEGGYHETEQAIQKLLSEKHPDLPEISDMIENSACIRPTPELYLGYNRGHIVNTGGYYYDEISNYDLTDEVPLHGIGLIGPFESKGEYIESQSSHSELILNFFATEVNLVFEALHEDATVKILFDDQNLPEDIRGSDVDSDSVLHVQKARMYNLLKSNVPMEGKLTIKFRTNGIRAYAFTFSGCY